MERWHQEAEAQGLNEQKMEVAKQVDNDKQTLVKRKRASDAEELCGLREERKCRVEVEAPSPSFAAATSFKVVAVRDTTRVRQVLGVLPLMSRGGSRQDVVSKAQQILKNMK